MHRCEGQRQTGAAGESTLSNGDVIEIFTSKSEIASPSQDWLGFVQSPRARTKIRQYFNKERREIAIEQGKEAIAKAMRKQGLPLQRMLTSEALTTIARELHLADVTATLCGGRRESVLRPVGRRTPRGRPRWRRRRHRGPRRDRGADAPPPTRVDRARPGRRGAGRLRHLDQARPVLHPGAR